MTTAAVSVEEQLRAVPLFAASSEEELARIASVARPAAFARGRTICAEGVFGVGMHVITEGWVQVRATHAPDTRLGPGAYFGEMAVLNQTTRNATVRCVESLDVLSIHKREFSALAANLTALRESFEQVVKQRNQATESVLAEVAG